MTSFFGPIASLALAMVLAAPVPPAPVEPEEAESPPRDPAELETFLDGVIPALMEAYHVPGSVVVVVKNDGILLAKGYGWADLASRRAVDPDTTLFRVASVSKLFTTTAVLQLVEQGRLVLDADVNDYLDFEIDTRFDEPITLANLLTHTPGFDDEYLRTSQSLGETPVPLGRFLAKEMPEQVLPPGDTISYSNQGLALAGYIVERASGQPFEDYVREHVLAPLGMDRSRFGIPSAAAEGLATPYRYDDGRHTSLGFDRLVDAPAGDLITTGTDIARFMIAQLRLGEYEGVRVLEETTARMMQSRHFSHHPDMPGWCYGFYEGQTHGIRTVEHGGSWRGFGTELFLLPDHGVGVFLSTNLEYSPRFFEIARRRFFDRYFPREPALAVKPPSDFAERAAGLAGSYLAVRRVRNSILKLGDFMGVFRVAATDDDELEIRFPNDVIPPRRMVEIGPGLYREVEADSMASVRLDEDGDPSHILLGGGALEKLTWSRDPGVHAVLLAGALALFVLSAGGWILGLLSRWVAGGPPSGVQASARFVAWLVCVLQSVFLYEMFTTLTTIDVYSLMGQEVPGRVKVLLVIPLVSAVLTLAMVYRVLKGFRTKVDAPLSGLHYLVLTVAAVGVVVLEWHWNVLGFWV